MSDLPKRRVVDPRVGSLDPPQRMVGVPSGRLLQPTRARQHLLHWENTPLSPFFFNTNTHTRRHGREAPENGIGSTFYTFCLFSRNFVATGTGLGPRARSGTFANLLEFTICHEI
jgi:hypothetical protein